MSNVRIRLATTADGLPMRKRARLVRITHRHRLDIRDRWKAIHARATKLLDLITNEGRFLATEEPPVAKKPWWRFGRG